MRFVMVTGLSGVQLGRPICLITSRMITDRIGRHEVLLLVNHNLNKICDI